MIRRRLLRLTLVAVVLPVAGRSAAVVADRMERRSGPTAASRSLRRASWLIERRRRRRR